MYTVATALGQIILCRVPSSFKNVNTEELMACQSAGLVKSFGDKRLTRSVVRERYEYFGEENEGTNRSILLTLSVFFCQLRKSNNHLD